jgi:hypothetical protein
LKLEEEVSLMVLLLFGDVRVACCKSLVLLLVFVEDLLFTVCVQLQTDRECEAFFYG